MHQHHEKYLRLGLVVALVAAGCNELVGIREPLDDPPAFSEGGGGGSSSVAGSAGTTATAGTAGSSVAEGGAAGGGALPVGEPGGGGGDGSVEVSTPQALAHAWAEWPMPNPPSTGLPNPQTYDTAAITGVVVDRVTGLDWQRAPSSDPRGAGDAKSYCDGLKLSGSGWRLPTRIELLSLINVGAQGPLIDSIAFPGTPVDHAFWTVSPVAGDAQAAWSVDFGFGDGLAYVSPLSANLHVRCTRKSAGEASATRYSPQEGFVSDDNTELSWEEPAQTSTFALAQAGEYCRTLGLDGGGWRLPSINELHSLVDETRPKLAIDPAVFPSTPPDFFWTSSTVTGFTNYGWTVSFANGTASFFDGSQQHLVRCVR